jgi:hypothetical protein
MSRMRKFGLGATAFALLITSASPALAGGGYGYDYGGRDGYGGHHRKHRGDNDTAEVLGGVLIGAVLVGVLSSASRKSKRNRDTGADYPRDTARYPDNRDERRGSIATEDQAVDACAIAAEEKTGRSSSVRDISNVRRSDDGWDVEGVIESRDNWRDRAASKRKFTCSVRLGAVDNVYVEDRSIAFSDR